MMEKRADEYDITQPAGITENNNIKKRLGANEMTLEDESSKKE